LNSRTSDNLTELSSKQGGAVEQRLEALRKEIRRHSDLYYIESRPDIDDTEFDILYEELLSLEATHPHLVTPDSPSQQIGGTPRGDFAKAKHMAPMLSLDSAKNQDEARSFDQRIRKGSEGDPQYLLEPKLDGASIEIVYENGLLVRAVTRGDGQEGEVVTENVKTISSVPEHLLEGTRKAPKLLSLRGEVIMYLSAFEDLNARMIKQGSEPYVNPRNSASGSLRQLDPQVTAERSLDVLAYDILVLDEGQVESGYEGLQALKDWGFRTPDRTNLVTTVEEIVEYHRKFEEDRDELDYEIDGIVIKLNDLDSREDFGSTSHHPRWALALKFEPRKEITYIEKIAISVGRTGKLTPVALLRPVEVGGVTVSRASLHNKEELSRKDVREGDMVKIQRAGDVIPQVIERIEEEGVVRGPIFQMPERCPACDTRVRASGPFIYCTNSFGCPAQLKRGITHFGSRAGLDIEGLGEETANVLVERGLVKELANLFDLKNEDLEQLEGFAEKSAANLVDAIQAKKSIELHRFLYGLGIPNVGTSIAQDLANHFRSFEKLRASTRNDLESVEGIGTTLSEQIRTFLDEERNATLIQAVLDRGIDLIAPEYVKSGMFSGQSFVFTGKLTGFTRSEAKKLIENAGGRLVGSVSGDTNYVVMGNDPGSKLQKAKELGVTIITEPEFVILLNNGK
tara:strand:- start:10733 stop:12781 length:2049 start_codon:yes stop_codon:yes gene_type:complete